MPKTKGQCYTAIVGKGRKTKDPVTVVVFDIVKQ
jgi:hypothetical protein